MRPLADEPEAAEVRRIFVSAPARRGGLARALMIALEERALEMGYAVLKLETGNRQIPAIRFYESLGYCQIEPFGPYVDDPISVCFAKNLERG